MTYDSPFYTIIIILSLVEIIGNISQYIIFYCQRYDPLVKFFLLHPPISFIFTFLFDILEWSYISFGCYSLFIAIIRLFNVSLKTRNSKILEKIVYPLHFFVIFISTVQIIFAPVYYGYYTLDVNAIIYSRNDTLGKYKAVSFFFNNKNELLISTVISTVSTILLIIVNIIVLIQFQITSKVLFNTATIKNKMYEHKLNIYLTILSIKQLLYFLPTFTQRLRPKINGLDDSIYQLLQGIKPFLINFNFLLSPIIFIYLNYDVRKTIISFFKIELFGKINNVQSETSKKTSIRNSIKT
ncbi:Hypothetical protein SRAE_1000020300 [Strongyloides ratti]|uniref:7TM GPCR, serpentine receptor class v (Srv) family-containing protein n=1 Tax=Strongyloides ratti TaxID=34506 RepID=A0A090L1C9_STRRB|nr:Hypothetical protein SRAE_1000020300 [Strongyloides ratti]CEF61927.1 Hypothetical protein SRAE_1000020300 [Strongyloides ratti]